MNRSTHILLIDDDELSRELLQLLLEAESYAVTAAASGDEALSLLGDRVVDVVLADLQMPGLSGSGLAQRVRTIAPQTILLAMSGSQPAAEQIEGYDGFLLKPFTMEQFAEACSPRTTLVEETCAAEPAPVRVLDETIYRRLAESMPSQQLSALYTLCLDDAAKRIATMRGCAARGDDAGYRQAAHAIKGGCGMVGATELQALAGRMEQQGLSAANYVASLDEFILASERLRRILIATSIG